MLLGELVDAAPLGGGGVLRVVLHPLQEELRRPVHHPHPLHLALLDLAEQQRRLLEALRRVGLQRPVVARRRLDNLDTCQCACV